MSSSETTIAGSSTSTPTPPPSPPAKKVNEFEDGRQKPAYTWKQSWSDYFKQAWKYSDAEVEQRLLSQLSFFPEPNGKRSGHVINTPIGDGNFIHEFYIENKETDVSSKSATQCKEIVLIHGYAASLGLFIDNFDELSKIPGVKIHAIDLLGFGMSARPKFPSLPSSNKEEIYKVEDWFIDSLETWRKKRGIDKFVLMGHSFGGYLSCAYVLKHKGEAVDKLVLISPVGVERSKFSLLDDKTNEPRVSLEQEFLADQEDIVHGKGQSVSHSGSDQKEGGGDVVVDENKNPPPKSTSRKLVDYMWEKNYSPFSLIRNSGVAKSKLISRWTTHRFAHTYYQNPEHFQNMHDYIYRVFNGAGSGEYAITRVLAVGALAKLPLLDRCPQKFVDMKLPSLWLYGDKDWMNEKAGEEATREINKLSQKKYHTPLAQFQILKNAGHHLYLDNPPDFARIIFKFLGYK
ncbi:uncharacterized protein LODBEIA_P59450 [Lodderomyces beijingensis]|uniref:AB hydrolase-1 domain-containing protein n=1 Tax=Lodderomyces beijingensis TaxID=1775926 RepID=A0ABP0ZW21_9ASCO